MPSSRQDLPAREPVESDESVVGPGDPVDAPPSRVAPVRWGLLAFAVVVAAAKLVVAHRTHGTNDVVHWTEFVNGVRRYGPLDVYVGHYSALYNHPPLIGWWLDLVGAVSSHVPWLTVRFLVRVPATLADVLSTLVVFELLRERRSLREAAVAAALVAFSPVLFVISGFHGNTDPVFVLFTLAAAWLLVDRRLPTAAGVAIGLALSIKLVPIGALVVLLVAAWRGRYGLVRFVTGAGVVFAVLWVPVLLRHWRLFLANVVGYQGTQPADSWWGLVRFAYALGFSSQEASVLYGAGRPLLLLLCCAIPVVTFWRRPEAAPYAVALALALTLLLSPAYAVQYFAWAAAAVCLLNPWAGAAYNVLAGLLLVDTYTFWSGGLPWDRAFARGLTPAGALMCWPLWLELLIAVILGILRIRSVPAVTTVATPAAARGDRSDRSAPEEPEL